MAELQFLESSLGVWEQAVIGVSVAVILVQRTRTGTVPERAVLGLGTVSLLPLPLLLAPEGAAAFIAGKEGVIEALTAGVLLAAAWLARQRRAWLFCAAALLILAEEFDFGQQFLSTPGAPAVEVSGGGPNGNFNVHDQRWLGRAFRLVPATGALLLSQRERWPAPLRRLAVLLGLPALHRRVGWGLLLALCGGVLVRQLGGEGVADEASELAVVAVVWAALLVRQDEA